MFSFRQLLYCLNLKKNLFQQHFSKSFSSFHIALIYLSALRGNMYWNRKSHFVSPKQTICLFSSNFTRVAIGFTVIAALRATPY